MHTYVDLMNIKRKLDIYEERCREIGNGCNKLMKVKKNEKNLQHYIRNHSHFDIIKDVRLILMVQLKTE